MSIIVFPHIDKCMFGKIIPNCPNLPSQFGSDTAQPFADSSEHSVIEENHESII
jgi:hypothetical protein